ncbi:MAG: hypothetical protein US18_C0028G0004 [Parcubacteria group bacterium GW2011_GWB1_36_5]|nr:MAG: hypothetical protein US18_C0028G0004 [Parcubacteria group bacterium GW2011_GWB1_36_5]
MAKHLLVTRPEYDYTTRYISAWAKKYFELAEQKGYTVVDLRRKRANRKEFESVIKKIKPAFVILNGHGNKNEVAGNDNETLVETNTNAEILADKITYALSCQSAKNLGNKVGSYPNTTYIGYKEDFAFVRLEKYGRKPTEDTLAGFFIEPSNAIIVSLLKGHSTNESFTRGQSEFTKNIQMLLTSKIKSADSSVLRFLVWDLKHLTLCGDKNKAVG